MSGATPHNHSRTSRLPDSAAEVRSCALDLPSALTSYLLVHSV